MSTLLYDPKARLYLELHITVESQEDEKFPLFQGWAMVNNWRASRFSEDDVDGYNSKWFLSAREEYKSVAVANLKKTLAALTEKGHYVLRWKIEDTLLDSKYGDTL